ncbi:MAG: peptidoglycan-associated lipoprotein Pal [Alphaproteobacteria bacterium]|nr:peptidoglycan-associated lipoprotein Pal [Alphaproteobacteria bacterium]
MKNLNTQSSLNAVASGSLVHFAYDRYDLSAVAQAIIKAQVAWLQAHPTVTVTVEGNCDERGTREYNLALGDRRANSVKNYMVALGLDPARIRTISYGKERPLVIGTGKRVWAQNRRSYTRINN